VQARPAAVRRQGGRLGSGTMSRTDARERRAAPGAPGARPTLSAVARLAGVSPSTASLAFSGSGPVSEDARRRVLDAAATLGYAGPDPRARSLRRGRSGIVGIVLEDSLSTAFRDPVNIAMLDGLSDVVGAAGASLLLLPELVDGRPRLLDAPLDAAVLFGCSIRIGDTVEVVRRRGIPVVAIEGPPLDGVLDVGLDNREASRALAEHLRDLGHRRVAVVTLELGPTRRVGPVTPEREAGGTSWTTLERLRGVRDVFPDAPATTTTGSLVDEGRRAARELLDVAAADRPTAVVAQSDLLAAGVVAAAADLGLSVPGDVSVVGFDGIRVDDPRAASLTTMAQPSHEKGRAAGRAVLAMLDGGHPEPVAFHSTFRRGTTTGPAPA